MIDYFHNHDRPNYYEVSSYGPSWWLEWVEMDANYRYAGWTLDLMAYWMDRVVSNQFPMHADQETIEKLEKLFCIDVDYSMTLEERRRIVAAYYFYVGHLSRTAIKEIIRTCTDCESDVRWGGEDNNILKVDILQQKKDVLAASDRAYAILYRRKPAHIAMDVRVCVTRTFRQLLKMHFGGIIEAWFGDIPLVVPHRTDRKTLQVSFASYMHPVLDACPPAPARASPIRQERAGGAYCCTHTKSKLIG